MSSGPSLYRRHRPRTFADVVGQEAVVRTLRHAVERDQVHHAYLFVGSRGTGKTSMAKILAACLNCELGPTVSPCGRCDSCRGIANATSLDVIEMDAASHNSVDDVRDLRESVAFAPVSGRHKVYILDEAHMLSTQAWNALLKTLEEPPPSTIFVLATTEAQKVLPTVVDRCHRFDFHRPSVEQIAGVLNRVAGQEGIQMPAQAAALIARAATGSFRDALGTLEQLVTYSGSEIGLEDVIAVLGVADAELLGEAMEAVAGADARRALLAVARGVEGGRDPAGLIHDLETHARELLVVQTLGGQVPGEIALTPDADERLAAHAMRLNRADLVRLLDGLAAALEAVRAGADARTQLELALVKAATPEVDASTRALLARLERVEAALGRGAGPAAPAPAAPAPSDGPPASDLAAPAPASPSPAPAPGGDGGSAATAPQAVPAPAPAPGPLGPVTLESVVSLWPAVVEAVRETNSLLAAVIEAARPGALEGGTLTLCFAPDERFLRRQAEDAANRAVVAETVRALTGASLRLSFDTREPDQAAPEAEAPTDEDWVRRFVVEFDAEEVPVEPGAADTGQDADQAAAPAPGEASTSAAPPAR